MSSNDNQRLPAQTIGELDLHLSYLQQAVKSVGERLSEMATKDDIEAITDRMEEFATKTELRVLQEKVDGISPKSMMAGAREVLLTVTLFAAACGAVVALIRWLKPGAL
jgi:hypothetical protein